jgi:hypothetical protein
MLLMNNICNKVITKAVILYTKLVKSVLTLYFFNQLLTCYSELGLK